MGPVPGPVTEPCPCARCTEPVRVTDAYGETVVWNNLHGRLRPCETCGRPKSEYVDLGTRGYYECWWCGDRAGGADITGGDP